MSGLFQGLEIGRRSLLTAQMVLQTIGHNIANVNTPGYTRQRVNITSTIPDINTIGVIGTGVQVADIRHIRDLFLGTQYRQENKSLGQWKYKEKVLSEIEALFNEPNDGTLSDVLNGFWDAWSDLSNSPESTSARAAILAQSKMLTNGFHQLANQLNDLRDSIDRDMVSLTEDINLLTGEIARLNGQIKKTELGNIKANDLRDARDLLIDDLSSIIDVNSVENKNGEVTVYIGAMSIVNGSEPINIDVKINNVNGNITHSLVWEGTSINFKNTGGQLKGLLDTRDEIIPRYLDELNTLAKTLITEVNAVHNPGFGLNNSTGVDFFDVSFTDAFNIKINSEIEFDISKIASSQSGEEGDNVIALAIHDLRNKRVLNNTNTFNDFYNSLVGGMGIESHEAKSFSANYDLLVKQIEFSRESVQGVSLDEEMVNMVKYQHAYDAAARVITTMDQALDTVINGMGLVGR
ncbi:MAG: flagellar hook-associated protein FlgK [Candidatus Zixiibacteriota bacterium]